VCCMYVLLFNICCCLYVLLFTMYCCLLRVTVYCRFIYVPAPHTADVICEELYDSLLEWNIDEKLMTVTVDNCTTND
jgi:hypothetical protein